jgi:hypothetical protein
MFTVPKRQFASNPILQQSIGKLAIAGAQAGFSVEQMIQLLSAGLDVATLLDLITWRLEVLSREESFPN